MKKTSSLKDTIAWEMKHCRRSIRWSFISTVMFLIGVVLILVDQYAYKNEWTWNTMQVGAIALISISVVIELIAIVAMFRNECYASFGFFTMMFMD